MNLESIAKYYAKWIVSEPFDGGMTTGLALGPLRKTPRATAAITNAFINNQSSQSNGSLMRITPLAVWASGLKSPFDLSRVVVADSKMTHPNKVVHACSFLYCQSIQHLLLHRHSPTKQKDAFELALKWSQEELGSATDHKTGETCHGWLQTSLEMFIMFLQRNEEPGKYGKSANHDCEILSRMCDFRIAQGWIKHAFILSYYFMLRSQCMEADKAYHHAICETIRQGGDTDTNACIVGGIVGAVVGLQNLPEDMLRKLISFDSTVDARPHHRRPKYLST